MPKIRDLGITTIHMSGEGEKKPGNQSGCEGSSCVPRPDNQSGCEGSSCVGDEDDKPGNQSGCEGSSCVPRSPRQTAPAEGFHPGVVAQLRQQLDMHLGN